MYHANFVTANVKQWFGRTSGHCAIRRSGDLFFATEISACGTVTPTVEDAMANIAVVFHWPPQAFEDMTLTELMQWHQKAIERNGSDAE